MNVQHEQHAAGYETMTIAQLNAVLEGLRRDRLKVAACKAGEQMGKTDEQLIAEIRKVKEIIRNGRGQA